MDDIFFVSSGEPNAEENWLNLRTLWPHARRIGGIKGIHAAHRACAEASRTEMFYVVDGDNWVLPTKGAFARSALDTSSVYVFRALNPVNGLVYGHGAVKIMPRDRVLAMPLNSVDMTTSISVSYRIIHECVSEHRFNTSAWDAWRTGFREAVKLSSRVITNQRDDETAARLDVWCSKASEVPYAEDCLAGARAGRDYGLAHKRDHSALAIVNDFEKLHTMFEARGTITPMAANQTPDVSNVLSGLSNIVETLRPDDTFLADLMRTVRRHPEENWRDILSRGQIRSKLWLIEELKKIKTELGMIYVLGSWAGLLPALMIRDGSFNGKYRCFDIDPSCTPVAEDLNRTSVTDGWRVKATTADMFKIDYANHQYETFRRDGSRAAVSEVPDTIINTSCDHVHPFAVWWDMVPPGRLVVLQNNDFRDADEDHVNTVSSLEEMMSQAPMAELLFAGELDLGRYRRFMLVGRR